MNPDVNSSHPWEVRVTILTLFEYFSHFQFLYNNHIWPRIRITQLTFFWEFKPLFIYEDFPEPKARPKSDFPALPLPMAPLAHFSPCMVIIWFLHKAVSSSE